MLYQNLKALYQGHHCIYFWQPKTNIYIKTINLIIMTKFYLQILFASNTRQPLILDDQHVIGFLRSFGSSKDRAGRQIVFISLFPGMYNQSHMAIVSCREGPKGSNYYVLLPKAVSVSFRFRHSHHELHIVDYYVRYVVHVRRVFYSLKKANVFKMNF